MVSDKWHYRNEAWIPNTEPFRVKNGQQLLSVLYLMETHDELGSNTAVWQWRSKEMGHFRYHFRDIHSSWCSSIPGHSSVKHDTCHRLSLPHSVQEWQATVCVRHYNPENFNVQLGWQRRSWHTITQFWKRNLLFSCIHFKEPLWTFVQNYALHIRVS